MTTIGGADGCPGGWICVERDTVTREIFAEVLPTTADLRDRARHLAVLTVDIPIGLSETGPRDCDVEARRLLTSLRGSSVFPAPVRPAIDASSYAEACERSEAACGKRLSKQAHAIMWRIREVDEMLRGEPELQGRVREIHPEVCFYELANKKPMAHNKSSRLGREDRRKALAAVFPKLNQVITEGGEQGLPIEDILDATVACWSALRLANEKGRSVSDVVSPDANVAIWV